MAKKKNNNINQSRRDFTMPLKPVIGRLTMFQAFINRSTALKSK